MASAPWYAQYGGPLTSQWIGDTGDSGGAYWGQMTAGGAQVIPLNHDFASGYATDGTAQRAGWNGNTWIEGGAGDSGGSGVVDPQFEAWLQQNNLVPIMFSANGAANRGLMNATTGEIVPDSIQSTSYSDRNFGLAALAAAAIATGGVAAASGAAGAGAGAASGGFGSGISAGAYGAGGLGEAGLLTGTGTLTGAYGGAGLGASAAGAGGFGAAGLGGAAAATGATAATGAGAASGGGFLGLTTGQLQAAQLAAGLGSTYLNGQAAQNASQAQIGAAQAGQNQLQQSQAAVMASLQPYLQTGAQGLQGQATLAGLNGPQQQQAAIDALKASPAFTSAQQLGENRILANASATGGLRGGNTQAALAQFSPALLAATINDQYSRLGGLSGMGFNATQVGAGTQMQTGANVANLLGQQGAAAAGGALAAGRTNSGYLGVLGNVLGLYAGLGGGAQQTTVPNISAGAYGSGGFGSSGGFTGSPF